jgi:hypothetical protein
MANEHATLVRSLEDARAVEAAVAEEERNRLENEVALLREQVQAMEATVNEAEAAKLQALAQVSRPDLVANTSLLSVLYYVRRLRVPL